MKSILETNKKLSPKVREISRADKQRELTELALESGEGDEE